MRRPVQPHVVLEQELQVLLQEASDGSVEDVKRAEGGDDDEAKSAIKKRVRVIKNRLAAKRSREQARTYVQQLESTLNALAAQNEFLARRLAAVEAENSTLKRGVPLHPRPQDGQRLDIDQKEFRGEPAVLPHSSLQLDGLFLISIIFRLSSLCLSNSNPIQDLSLDRISHSRGSWRIVNLKRASPDASTRPSQRIFDADIPNVASEELGCCNAWVTLADSRSP